MSSGETLIMTAAFVGAFSLLAAPSDLHAFRKNLFSTSSQPSSRTARKRYTVSPGNDFALSTMLTAPTKVGLSDQLKKLINHIVQELSSLGLSPVVLHELLEHSKNETEAVGRHFKVYFGSWLTIFSGGITASTKSCL